MALKRPSEDPEWLHVAPWLSEQLRGRPSGWQPSDRHANTILLQGDKMRRVDSSAPLPPKPAAKGICLPCSPLMCTSVREQQRQYLRQQAWGAVEHCPHIPSILWH